MKRLKILVGCEESQTLTKKLRDEGHFAYSCDVIDTRGNKDWHIKGCVKKAITNSDQWLYKKWDMIFLFPPCTNMCLSGNRWYGKGKPLHQKRIDAINWTMDLWKIATSHSQKVILENPASVIFPYLKNAGANVTYCQPWEHGHGEKKKTGFATTKSCNLPKLLPSNIVKGRKALVHLMPPSSTRARDRSKTFDGIATALVKQLKLVNYWRT
jgi:hypothetical protein|tara:strand:+ start:666 stop:1301 length:636 start_codon:yes stop_codon:yes gene_type:complete